MVFDLTMIPYPCWGHIRTNAGAPSVRHGDGLKPPNSRRPAHDKGRVVRRSHEQAHTRTLEEQGIGRP